MSIRREHRYFYPIDWKQLSAVIRFVRARGRCEGCGRPHMEDVQHLGDGRWWDAEIGRWRDGRGRQVRHTLPAPAEMAVGAVKARRVVLATAHRNHDTADNTNANLVAFCQRCHMLQTGQSISGVGASHCARGRPSGIYSAASMRACKASLHSVPLGKEFVGLWLS